MTTPTTPVPPSDRDRSAAALPDRPNLRFLKDKAKAMVKMGDATTLAIAQLSIARAYGFASWPKLKEHIEALAIERGESPTRQLLGASTRGDLAAVKQAVASGANVKHVYDIEAGYQSFCPPLKPAIEGGHTECVGWLLKRGALDRVWSYDGLRDAESRGHADIIALLREHRASEDQLMDAITTRDHDRVVALLEDDPTLAYANEAGHGPLRAPLLMAADLGDAGIAENLLNAGADPAAEHHATSVNALTHALYHGHAEVITLLEARGVISDNVTNYLFAALMGNQNRVKMYLDADVDVNAKDHCEQHVINAAFRSGNDALVRYLIERGADVNQSNGWAGWIWFSDYIKRGDVDSVRKILDLGYDVNIRDDNGRTALHWAEHYQQPEVAALLRERGATSTA